MQLQIEEIESFTFHCLVHLQPLHCNSLWSLFSFDKSENEGFTVSIWLNLVHQNYGVRGWSRTAHREQRTISTSNPIILTGSIPTYILHLKLISYCHALQPERSSTDHSRFMLCSWVNIIIYDCKLQPITKCGLHLWTTVPTKTVLIITYLCRYGHDICLRILFLRLWLFFSLSRRMEN